MSYYKDRIIEFPKDKKELLDLKISREIKKLENENFILISLAKDFESIINYGNFSENELDKMINCDNIILKLISVWQEDKKVLELQEKLLEEFLNSTS